MGTLYFSLKGYEKKYPHIMDEFPFDAETDLANEVRIYGYAMVEALIFVLFLCCLHCTFCLVCYNDYILHVDTSG